MAEGPENGAFDQSLLKAVPDCGPSKVSVSVKLCVFYFFSFLGF